MSKFLIIIILLIINGYIFSSTPRDIHRDFLNSLEPDDIGNEFCATSLSKDDLRYLEERWEKEKKEIEDFKQPSIGRPLFFSKSPISQGCRSHHTD